jgi:hypothetical protein
MTKNRSSWGAWPHGRPPHRDAHDEADSGAMPIPRFDHSSDFRPMIRSHTCCTLPPMSSADGDGGAAEHLLVLVGRRLQGLGIALADAERADSTSIAFHQKKNTEAKSRSG